MAMGVDIILLLNFIPTCTIPRSICKLFKHRHQRVPRLTLPSKFWASGSASKNAPLAISKCQSSAKYLRTWKSRRGKTTTRTAFSIHSRCEQELLSGMRQSSTAGRSACQAARLSRTQVSHSLRSSKMNYWRRTPLQSTCRTSWPQQKYFKLD